MNPIQTLSLIFRDYERRKNSLSVLQNQLQQQEATRTSSSGFPRIRPPDFSFIQPSDLPDNVHKQNGSRNLGNRSRGGIRGSVSLSQDNISAQVRGRDCQDRREGMHAKKEEEHPFKIIIKKNVYMYNRNTYVLFALGRG